MRYIAAGRDGLSGGIFVVGGPGYGTCPDGSPCAYTTGIQAVQNTLTGRRPFLRGKSASFPRNSMAGPSPPVATANGPHQVSKGSPMSLLGNLSAL